MAVMFAVTRSLLMGLCCIALLPSMVIASSLTLVAEDDWYPYSAERQGEARGISVDIVRAAYAAVGVDVSFKVMSYARCMQLLDIGEEIGCFNTPADADIREQQVLPEHALDTNPAYIYVRGDHPYDDQTLAEHSGNVIGIVNGYRYGDVFMSDPQILREYSASDLQNLKKLAAGRLDYIVLYDRVARYLIGQYGDELGINIKPVTLIGNIEIYVSFSRNHPDSERAKRQFDEGMSVLQKEGRYAKILNEWDKRLVYGMAAN